MKKKSSDTTGAKSKKSKGYYLELDEAENPAPASTSSAPTKAEVVVPEPIQTKVTTEPAPQPITDSTKSAAKQPKEPQTETAPVAPAKAAKPEVKPTPEPVVATTPEPEILPAYLQPNNTPRRRPGANMAMFKDMAQQIKNP